MSILSETVEALKGLLPIETGVLHGKSPDRYAVITPLADSFENYSDNRPSCEIQEARISLFDRGNYTKTKDTIITSLLHADIAITSRRYIAREDETGYHHYNIDISKLYELEETTDGNNRT